MVAVHVLDTGLPISLQFPTFEDTQGTMWKQMEDSLFLPAQSMTDHSHQGKLMIISASTITIIIRL